MNYVAIEAARAFVIAPDANVDYVTREISDAALNSSTVFVLNILNRKRSLTQVDGAALRRIANALGRRLNLHSRSNRVADIEDFQLEPPLRMLRHHESGYGTHSRFTYAMQNFQTRIGLREPRQKFVLHYLFAEQPYSHTQLRPGFLHVTDETLRPSKSSEIIEIEPSRLRLIL